MAGQIERVDSRIISGVAPQYAAERDHVRIAANRVLCLQRELGLGRFLGPVGHVKSKPQFLLGFQTEQGRAVLKVYGRARASESLSQRIWSSAGVPVPSLYSFDNTPTSWLLMEYLDGEPLYLPGQGLARMEDFTTQLAHVMAQAHGVSDDPVLVSSEDWPRLEQELTKHLSAVLPSLLRHGYHHGLAWPAILEKACRTEHPVILHGDLAGANVLRCRSDQELALIDICGYLGPREFDAARWAARSGGALKAHLLLELWLQLRPDFDRRRALAFLGLELLMEAGVREIVKDEIGESPDADDAGTIALILAAQETLADIL